MSTTAGDDPRERVKRPAALAPAALVEHWLRSLEAAARHNLGGLAESEPKPMPEQRRAQHVLTYLRTLRSTLEGGDLYAAVLEALRMMRAAAEADLELREPDAKRGREADKHNARIAPLGGIGKGKKFALKNDAILRAAQGIKRRHPDWGRDQVLEDLRSSVPDERVRELSLSRLKRIVPASALE